MIIEPEVRAKIMLGICGAFIIFLVIVFYLQLIQIFFYGLFVFVCVMVLMAPFVFKGKMDTKYGSAESFKKRYKVKKSPKIKYNVPKIKKKSKEEE